MNKKEFTFYSDSGHGWLEVDVSLVVELGLQDKISTYSYIDKGKVYLEEDCDSPLFIKTYNLKYGSMVCNEVYIEGDCFIRAFKHYRGVRQMSAAQTKGGSNVR